MSVEDTVVGQMIAGLVRQELLAERNDSPMLRLVGFSENEVRTAMQLLTADERIRVRRIVIKVATHDGWQGDPEEWFLAAGETQVQFRNASTGGLVLFDVEEQSDSQSLRNMHCIQDGTLLDPDAAGGGLDRRRAIAQIAWDSVARDARRPLPEELANALEAIFHVVERESGQLALRTWVSFVVRCAGRVASSGIAVSGSVVRQSIVEELPWLNLFYDDLLYAPDGGQETKRLIRNVRMAANNGPTGKELEEEDLERRIESTDFKDEEGKVYSASDQESWANRCRAVLEHRGPKQYRDVPLRIWEQIFAKEKETQEGLGSRIAKYLESKAPDRVAEYDDLEVRTELDDQDPAAAKRLLDEEARDPEAAPLCDLLSTSLRKAVEKLANPRSPTVAEPLVAILQHLYEALVGKGSEFETLELRIEDSQNSGGEYTAALFRFLYAKTLAEIADGSEDEHPVPLRVDSRLVEGSVDFVAVHRKRHADTGSDDADDAAASEVDVAVELAWEDLRLQLVGQPRDRVLCRFSWSALDARGPAGLVALSRLVSEASRVARVRGGGPDLESWCELMRDPRNPLDGDFPLGSDGGPVDAWKDLRGAAFGELREGGLSCDRISAYVDGWKGLLDRALRECVPSQERHEELEAFLEMETFRPVPGRFVLLATHPIRLRWISAYLKSLRDQIRSLLGGQFRLNPEVGELFFSKLSEYSPHRQPPVASPGHQALSVATREFGWHEEYRSIVEADSPSQSWVSSIDGESVSAMAGVVRRYLEAHPHKVDGLSILFISRDGDAEHVERLAKEIRSGDAAELVLTIHVVAPQSSHEEIVRKLEGLGDKERFQTELLPRIRTILHPISVVESHTDARRLGLEDQVDLVMVPNLFGLKTSVQTDTQVQRPGSFDPLLDDPTHDTNGEAGGGRKNVAKDFLPFNGDDLLEGWSSLQVWRKNWQRVGKGGDEQVNFFSLQVLFTASARLFALLHQWGHWVVTLDPYVGRDQVEASEHRPDVITVQPKVGKNGRYTMIVSSSTGRAFVVDRLERQLGNVLGQPQREEATHGLAEVIYDSSRDFAPGVVLRALGLGRTTQEILGLVVSRVVVEERRPRGADAVFEAWLSLDELPHWFGGVHRPRADMLRAVGQRDGAKLCLRFEIVEAKYRETEDRGKGELQLSRTREVLEPAMQPIDGSSGSEYADAAMWRRELLAAIEQCAGRASQGRRTGGLWVRGGGVSVGLPEDIRLALVEGNYGVAGMETILCTVAAEDDNVTEEEKRTPDGAHAWFRVGSAGLRRILRSIESGGDAGEATPTGVSGGSNEECPPTGPVESGNEEVKIPRLGEMEDDGRPRSLPAPVPEMSSADGAVVVSNRASRGIGPVELESRYQKILNLFSEFKIPVERPDDYAPLEGPAFYEVRLVPGKGVKSDRLTSQVQELKLRLALPEHLEVRGYLDRGAVVFQIPKDGDDRYYIGTDSLWTRSGHPEGSRGSLRTPIGEDASGEPVVLDLSDTDSPHLLIGGTTGSGKSVALESILEGLCAAHSAERLRLRLIDPKGTELSGFEGRDHLEGEIGMDGEDAAELLEAEVLEMERRYRLFKAMKKERGVRVHMLVEYNEHVTTEPILPWRLIVLDEYADLTSSKEDRQRIEPLLQRIAQKGRAAGIHLIVATQKPSAEILSTAIRSNLPAQLALRVKTASDSRIVMDEIGAETLAGRGDAFLKTQKGLVRVQTARYRG